MRTRCVRPWTSVRALRPDNRRISDRSLLRRRVIVVITLVIGATLLHLAFAQPAGSTAFYGLTLALAITGSVGGLLSGPLPFIASGRSRDDAVRDAGVAVALGAVVAGIFIAGASIVALIHPLRRLVVDVVTHTHGTSFALILVVTVVNAVAEEIFFRGAVYAAIGERFTVALTTLVYVATILVSGNIALAFAAAVLGAVLAVERRMTGGLLAPALTHVTWSALMLIVLPLLFPH
jgi:membrane protease YdiL (CAAX protease family)